MLAQAGAYGVEAWRDAEGQLIGWKTPAPPGPEPLRSAVVFHGNGGMAIHRSYYAEGLQLLDGQRWAVYILEYPGYGSREGRPTEKAFYEAARETLTEISKVEGELLFLIGESLGSGVATQMAAEFSEQVDGILLVTPFTTLADVGARHFWGFPVRLLLRDRYNNVSALAEYSGPVAILLAEHDEIIPVDLGQELYETIDGPKRLWIQKGQTHNTLDLTPGLPWWEELTGFLMEE